MTRLKYLFTSEYSDGTFFKQNEEDVSMNDPKRSSYFDVDQNRLVGFCLSGEGSLFGVDLRDGHFEINGVPFFVHDVELTDFKLIFFRKHRHTVTLGGEDVSHLISYRLGWSATDQNGQTIERVLQFI